MCGWVPEIQPLKSLQVLTKHHQHRDLSLFYRLELLQRLLPAHRAQSPHCYLLNWIMGAARNFYYLHGRRSAWVNTGSPVRTPLLILSHISNERTKAKIQCNKSFLHLGRPSQNVVRTEGYIYLVSKKSKDFQTVYFFFYISRDDHYCSYFINEQRTNEWLQELVVKIEEYAGFWKFY